MIDITTNERDREYFITNLEISDDYKTYTVNYASGRNETYPFSVHNYNVDVHLMENQYYKYKDKYEEEIINISTDIMVNKIKHLLESAIICVLMFDITDNLVIRISTILMVLLMNIKRSQSEKETLLLCGTSLEYLKQIDRYFESKDELKVPVVDPMNKQEEDWYLVNLSNVEETIFAPNLYKELANNLSDDVKKELSDNITKKINGQATDDGPITLSIKRG